MNRKRKFKSNNNPLKQYTQRHSPSVVKIYAEQCQRDRLASPTIAEDAFASILRTLAVAFEREAIIYRDGGSRFIIVDFMCRDAKVAFEIDGNSHESQAKYDVERDVWLQGHGVKTVRFTNSEVLMQPDFVRTSVMEVLGLE